MNMKFEMKTEDIKKNLDKIIRKTPEIAIRGLHEAMKQLKDDCDNIAPRTPHLYGPLRDSGETKPVSPNDMSVIQGNKLIGEVSYNQPYAAKWHEAEGFVNWSEAETGVGAKYVESKLVNLGEKYLEIVAVSIREYLQ